MQPYLFFLRAFLALCFLAFVYGLGLLVHAELAPAEYQQNLIHKRGANGHLWTRLRELPEYQGADILVIGSSHAYRGIDPRAFAERGLRLFNLGSSSQSPIQSEFLLRRYLPVLRPRLLLFEVYPELFCQNESIESALDMLANAYLGLDMFCLLYRQPHTKLINSGIYSFYKQKILADTLYQEPRERGKDRYVSGGYVEREEGSYQAAWQEQGSWQIDASQWRAFQNCLALARQEAIPVLLIQAPVTKVYFQSIQNQSFIDSLFAAQAPYRNYNRMALALEDTAHFYDAEHLNARGVSLFMDGLLRDSLLWSFF